MKEYHKKYYSLNKDKVLNYQKEWSENNKDKRNLYGLRTRLKDTARRLLNVSKTRAKKDGIYWNLVKEDIIVPNVCPVFKVPFQHKTPYAASLDRIDNTGGYTKDNIQVISRKANLMKANATKEQLKLFAEWILSNV